MQMSSSRRSSDFLNSPSTFKAMYNSSRKTDFAKLKLICSNALEKMSAHHLLDLAIDICKKPSEERLTEEIRILIKATENMPFFQEINRKNSHIRMSTHEKICNRMTYEAKKKGSAVMNFGDPASKFYIILKGSVNIYVPKDKKTMLEDANSNKNITIPDRILKKLAKWRTEFKDILEKNPINSSTLRENPKTVQKFFALQRKATRELNPEIVKQLAGDLTEKSPVDSTDESCYSETLRKESMAHTELFTENDREQMKKIEGVLGNLPLFSLENPEKYFEHGVFKFHFISELKAGQIFGEVGLSMKKTRSATVIANQNSEFAVLSCEDFKKILQNVEKRNIENRVEFFRESVFKGISVDVVVRMSLLFKKMKFLHGNQIYCEGDESNEMFLIKKGEIQVLKRIREKNQENETSIKDFIHKFRKTSENRVNNPKFLNVSVSKLSSGQYFGEEDILKNCKRSTSAIAISSKVTVFQITKQNFLKILNENEILHHNFLSNFHLKSSWLKIQIKNCIEKRSSISILQKSANDSSTIYPIRREIKEIFEPESFFIKKASSQNMFSHISSLQSLSNRHLKTNKIIDIVNCNEKTLEDLAKSGKTFDGNPFEALLECQQDFKTFSKMMCLRKAKHKNYGSGDPLNTRMKFDFNKFFKEKIKGFVENPNKNFNVGIGRNDGFLSERRERKGDMIKEMLNGMVNKRLVSKIGLKIKAKRAITAMGSLEKDQEEHLRIHMNKII